MQNENFSNPTSLGNVPENWKIKSIESLCLNVTTGGTPSRENPEFFTNGTISWVKTQELKDCDIHKTIEKITPDAIKNSAAKIFPKNTILMAMYGEGTTITGLGILRIESATNQACCAMIVNPDDCDYRFLFYALKYHRKDFLQLASGGAQRNLSGKLIRNFSIKVPPLQTQHSIARILGSLDDKIELNRKMNETLEAMARAIFQSWFMDFDPVRANAEGLDTGLPPEVAGLFPSEMVEVDGREVPKGWKYCKISDLVGINEKSIDQNYPHSSIEYIEISSVAEGKLESVTITNRLDAPSRAQRLVSHGDTIWSGVRPNRKSYLFIQKPKENLIISTGFITLSPKKIPPSFLYSWVTTELFVDYLTANADGSAYPAVRSEHFGDAEILLPAQPILEQFEKIAAPMRAKKHHNDEQSRTLAQIRDVLLPRLMSGEIPTLDGVGYENP